MIFELYSMDRPAGQQVKTVFEDHLQASSFLLTGVAGYIKRLKNEQTVGAQDSLAGWNKRQNLKVGLQS